MPTLHTAQGQRGLLQTAFSLVPWIECLSWVGGTPSPSEFSLCTLAAPDVNQTMEYLLQKCILELN